MTRKVAFLTVGAAAVLCLALVGALLSFTSVLTPGSVEVLDGFDDDEPVLVVDDPVDPDVPSVAPEPEGPEGQAPTTILLLGSDARVGQGEGFGDASVYSNARSDTAILFSVSGDRSAVRAMSFPRDLRVDIPRCGDVEPISYQRFNAAFERGGAACTAKTIKSITGIKPEHVVVVDFVGFQNIVDSIGGIEVCLNEPVVDRDSRAQLPAGWQVLDGAEALSLARARKSLSDGSDISRIKRQQALMLETFRQVKAGGILRNPVELFSLLSAIGGSLKVSPSLGTTAQQVALAASLSGVSPSDIRFETVPWLPAGDGQTVVLDEALAPAAFAELRDPQPARRGPGKGPERQNKPPKNPEGICGKDALF